MTDIEREDALLGIVMRALADARTQANPHDPAVQAHWRGEIRAALADDTGAVEALRELLPWAEGAQIRTNADVDRKAATLARARAVVGEQ